MIIIPALHISRGKCVTQYKGAQQQTIIHSPNPLQAARNFEQQGATVIHLVSADMAIAQAIAQKTKLHVQYADHIKDLAQIERLFGNGISCVSLSQSSEALLSDALARFGNERIMFTIRAQRNEIENKPAGLEVAEYGRQLVQLGVQHIIFRDMKAEGTLHPNFDEIERLAIGTSGTSAKIYAFGGVGSTDDLEILEKTGAYGAIISRAFFEGKLSLAACIEKFK